MLNLNSVMIGTMNLNKMAEFYEKVIGKPADMIDNGYHGWLVGTAFFMVGEHSKMKGKTTDPGRMMFNFETEDVKGEFDRIQKLGAEVVQPPYEMGGSMIATLSDPDGNYFQLMSPWREADMNKN